LTSLSLAKGSGYIAIPKLELACLTKVRRSVGKVCIVYQKLYNKILIHKLWIEDRNITKKSVLFLKNHIYDYGM